MNLVKMLSLQMFRGTIIMLPILMIWNFIVNTIVISTEQCHEATRSRKRLKCFQENYMNKNVMCVNANRRKCRHIFLLLR